MSEVAKINGGDKVVSFNPKQAESFVERLNDKPLNKNIKINSQANGSKYLPISFVENKLDEMFFGLWQIRNFRWQVVANEIVGSIELGVYHPVLKDWIWMKLSQKMKLVKRLVLEIGLAMKRKHRLV